MKESYGKFLMESLELFLKIILGVFIKELLNESLRKIHTGQILRDTCEKIVIGYEYRTSSYSINQKKLVRLRYPAGVHESIPPDIEERTRGDIIG